MQVWPHTNLRIQPYLNSVLSTNISRAHQPTFYPNFTRKMLLTLVHSLLRVRSHCRHLSPRFLPVFRVTCCWRKNKPVSSTQWRMQLLVSNLLLPIHKQGPQAPYLGRNRTTPVMHRDLRPQKRQSALFLRLRALYHLMEWMKKKMMISRRECRRHHLYR